MILSVLLSIAALAVLARLVFGLAVYALPALVGLGAIAAAHASGAGWLAAAISGFIAATLALGLGQTLFALARSPISRLLIGLAYGLPSAAIGFGLGYGVVGRADAAWRILVALAAAAFIGGVAYKRVSALAPPDGGSGPGGGRRDNPLNASL